MDNFFGLKKKTGSRIKSGITELGNNDDKTLRDFAAFAFKIRLSNRIPLLVVCVGLKRRRNINKAFLFSGEGMLTLCMNNTGGI